MGDPELKEVNFMKFCWLCKYGNRSEKYEPCNTCLELGMAEGTEKPIFFEEEKLHG